LSNAAVCMVSNSSLRVQTTCASCPDHCHHRRCLSLWRHWLPRVVIVIVVCPCGRSDHHHHRCLTLELSRSSSSSSLLSVLLAALIAAIVVIVICPCGSTGYPGLSLSLSPVVVVVTLQRVCMLVIASHGGDCIAACWRWVVIIMPVAVVVASYWGWSQRR